MSQENKSRFLEEDLQRIRGFRLLDDDFMSIVFDGCNEAAELLLNIIFDRDDMIVTEVIGQREIKNTNGHSVRLDIFATDSTGKAYDIEVQRADKGAVAQRARFNSSMMDTKLLAASEDYSSLIDSYVIFITENDVIGAGLPIYHINRWIEETRELFGDGSHILYVNGAYRSDENNIGKLMHDFRCTQPKDMNYSLLADRAKYFKESEGGQGIMCKVMEDMRNEAVKTDRIRTAQVLLKKGNFTYEDIAEATSLPIEEVKKLDNKQTA